MKAPKFWAKRGVLAHLLSPLGAVTAALTARRLRQPGFAPGIKVICVGNAGVGGAGKTVVALDILHRLQGPRFALTRGYRGRLAGPVLVNPALHTAEDVGDEALLLAAIAPTILAHDRAAGARLALAEGATAIVMDDGLQNPSLTKTMSLLVIDGGYGFGNLLLLPAGPLREPVTAAAARVQAAVLIGADETGALAHLPPALPVLRAGLVPECAAELRGRKIIAFAGIGRPEKFFASVRTLGGDLRATHAFPDHHVYRASDSARLLDEAAAQGAQLVTTAKDYVKLPETLRAATAVVTVRLHWDDESALERLLA
ncbi:tetraacyldisaccharide 4'-kinase [Acidocella sp.]|jgi:tetraacyldisaccharide 4'-kinase|uniref:tetraacyldisaccharide 4'-kinase n=1 Tax=Acidocella sp. TaxID=50710 RepID=UPI002F402F36